MVDRRLNARAALSLAAVVALFLGVLMVGKVAYDRYDESYVVARRDDGQAVSEVVRATFAKASALKVGSLSGTVQSTATDTRGFGMLTSDRVMKAPFSVDYFVDVSRLTAQDYRWDSASRTLTIAAPDVTVGKVNVDEAGQTLAQTRGLFVTRKAGEELARRTSIGAQSTAQVEAQKPERITAARENARAALRNLVGAPLAAAGLGDVRVVVTFPYDRTGPAERWDESRSVEDVLANRF